LGAQSNYLRNRHSKHDWLTCASLKPGPAYTVFTGAPTFMEKKVEELHFF
jgi:hypothetical protein